MKEVIWKPILGYEDYYIISSLADVRSLDRVMVRKNGSLYSSKGCAMKSFIGDNGYEMVSLRNGSGKGKIKRVHRLLAYAFLPRVKGKDFINHKNGIKKDNRIINLEWCNKSENTSHAYQIGILEVGENHHYAKLTIQDVVAIKSLLNAGKKQREIAEQFGVIQQTISHINTGKNWNHV